MHTSRIPYIEEKAQINLGQNQKWKLFLSWLHKHHIDLKVVVSLYYFITSPSNKNHEFFLKKKVRTFNFFSNGMFFNSNSNVVTCWCNSYKKQVLISYDKTVESLLSLEDQYLWIILPHECTYPRTNIQALYLYVSWLPTNIDPVKNKDSAVNSSVL